ncbi:S1C family serine protease [Paenibacillus sp. 1_12]|uniref:S1C family serine protease n=1 Tax=Paenibacillus sp. 1_12 TaxID=1566278 RepID=UPI0021094BB7|nr:trypsin-like peptidase domain-containing protein [Paenibacillus sp. 1_12]
MNYLQKAGKRFVLSVLAAILFVSFASTAVYADAAVDKGAVPAVIEKTTKSVVAIIGKPIDNKKAVEKNRYDLAHGTGVIVKSDGYILTNAHVVKNMRNIVVVTSDGQTYPGKTTHFDEESDLALVKIEASGLSPAVLADPTDLKVGESVMAIGTPLSFALRNSVTSGIVSGMDRSVLSKYQLIQTDAAINPGNSGGALVNMKGQVIGINTLKYVQYGVDGLGFAIPVATVQHVLDHFFKYGKVKRPSLGLELGESWEAVVGLPSSNGLEVTYVEPDSPGAKAGIVQGDVLLAINSTPTRNQVEYNEALKNYLPEQKVKLTIQSKSNSRIIEVVLGEEHSSAENVIQDVDGSYIDADQGKTWIGDSHYGWSMKYPAGLVKANEDSGQGNSVLLVDAKGEFAININIEEKQSEDISPVGLMKKLADDAKGTTLEKRFVEQKPQSYLLLVRKNERGEYYQIRAFSKGDKVYYLTLAVEKEDSYNNAIKRNSYNDLLDSFVLSFDASNPSLKDISAYQAGNTVTTEYGLVFDTPLEWNKRDWGNGLNYSSKDGEQTLSVQVSSAASGDTLKDWVARQSAKFNDSYTEGYKEIGESQDAVIGGITAIAKRYASTMGDKWRQSHVFYIMKDKYKYELKFTFPRAVGGEVMETLLSSFEKSVAFTKDGVNRSLGFIQDIDDLSDLNKTITYTNKKYMYTLHIPEAWQGVYQRELDSPSAQFSFNGGSLGISVDDRSSLEETTKRIEQDHKKNIEADANYKNSAADEELFGTNVRKFTTTYKSKNIPYTLIEYVFEKNGYVYSVRERINDAVKTEEQWQRLENAVHSIQLLSK